MLEKNHLYNTYYVCLFFLTKLILFQSFKVSLQGYHGFFLGLDFVGLDGWMDGYMDV